MKIRKQVNGNASPFRTREGEQIEDRKTADARNLSEGYPFRLRVISFRGSLADISDCCFSCRSLASFELQPAGSCPLGSLADFCNDARRSETIFVHAPHHHKKPGPCEEKTKKSFKIVTGQRRRLGRQVKRARTRARVALGQKRTCAGSGPATATSQRC
jgi:hypothetical protein